MSAAPKRRPVTAGLQALLAEHCKVPVGVTSAPTVGGVQVPYPYIVVYPIFGGEYSGPPFCGGTQDAAFSYQITVYGEREDSAELVADWAREAIIGRDEFNNYIKDLPLDDGKVMLRLPVGPSGRLVREGQVYRADEDYQIRVTSTS